MRDLGHLRIWPCVRCLCLIFIKEVLTWTVLVGRLSNSSGNALPYKNQEDSINLIEHLADALNTVSSPFCIRWMFFRDFIVCQGEFYFCIFVFSYLWPSRTSTQLTLYLQEAQKVACLRHISGGGSTDEILTSALILGMAFLLIFLKNKFFIAFFLSVLFLLCNTLGTRFLSFTVWEHSSSVSFRLLISTHKWVMRLVQWVATSFFTFLWNRVE